MKPWLMGVFGTLAMLPAAAMADSYRYTEIHIEEYYDDELPQAGYHPGRKHKNRGRAEKRPAYGRVLEVEPIVRRSSRDHNSCVSYVEDYGSYRSFTPTVLGGIIGSAVGYRLADDHGDPEVATIAAGLLGASLGRDIGRRVHESRRLQVEGPCVAGDYRSARYEPVEYRVTYRYNGRVYQTRMDHDPGDWVALDVKPA